MHLDKTSCEMGWVKKTNQISYFGNGFVIKARDVLLLALDGGKSHCVEQKRTVKNKNVQAYAA